MFKPVDTQLAEFVDLPDFIVGENLFVGEFPDPAKIDLGLCVYKIQDNFQQNPKDSTEKFRIKTLILSTDRQEVQEQDILVSNKLLTIAFKIIDNYRYYYLNREGSHLHYDKEINRHQSCTLFMGERTIPAPYNGSRYIAS